MRVIGYTYAGKIYCPDCLPAGKEDKEIGVIFIWDEWDYPVHCSICEEFIDVSLTSDGLEYVREALADYTGRPEILEIWRDAYESSL